MNRSFLLLRALASAFFRFAASPTGLDCAFAHAALRGADLTVLRLEAAPAFADADALRPADAFEGFLAPLLPEALVFDTTEAAFLLTFGFALLGCTAARFLGAAAALAGFALPFADWVPSLPAFALVGDRFRDFFSASADACLPLAGFACAALRLIAFSDIYTIAPLVHVIAIMPIKRDHKPF